MHIEGREAEAANTKTELIFEALKCIMEDATTNYVNRALLLDMDMSAEPVAVIKEYLLELAKKDPKKILNIYRSKSLRINLLYMQAKKAGIIVPDRGNGVIKYGVNVLGVSDESSIAFLQMNPDLMELLERELKPEYFEKKTEAANTKLSPAELAQKARQAKEAAKTE